MKKWTVEEIENARKLILKNAQELLSESELLFENKHFARSFTLSHLSKEELSKLPMLVKAGTNIVLGEKNNWVKLHKRMRSHSEKLMGYSFSRFIFGDEEELVNTKELNKLKNCSLYCGIKDGRFVKPSEIITEEIAAESISTTIKYLEFFEQVEKQTVGRTKEIIDSPDLEKYKFYMKKFEVAVKNFVESMKKEPKK